MVMQRGTWAIWSRGSKPTALTPWTEVTEHYGPTRNFEELLPAFLVMKSQGQHVRLEWMPEAAYGNVPKSNGHAQLDTELEAASLGFGYV